jgi:hypothetical protein
MAGPASDGAWPPPPVEEAVRRIWRDVLGVAEVGPHDNFFDIGGTSIFVPQILARINHAFDVQLSPLNLLESPTVSGLADCIQSIQRLERRAGESTGAASALRAPD